MEDSETPSAAIPRWFVVLVPLVLATIGLLVLVFVAKGLYVDWLWFSSVQTQDVYLKILTTQVALFLAGAGLCFAFFLPNVLLARRLAARRWSRWEQDDAPAVGAAGDEPDEDEARPPRDVTPLLIGLGAVVSLLVGWWASGRWQIALRLPNQSPFGQTDPLFGRDVAFFVFTLPVYQALRSWAFSALLLTILCAAAIYFARLVMPQAQGFGGRIDPETGERRTNLAFGGAIRSHLSLLGAAFCLLLVSHYRLRMLELVYSARGTTFGAGYTDVTAYWPVLWLLLGIMAAGAVALLAGTVVRGPWIAVGVAGLFIPVWLLGGFAYPAIVQRLQVAPNELELERRFIEYNIEFTRRAYGLDRVQESPFAVAEAVTRQEVEANPTTLKNVRLWDYEPLLATYNQVQSIRGYYEFLDADFDRYVIDGEYRQVMIAARELAPHLLPADAQTWVNRRLQFTHGYGVVVSPVNEVSPEGLPNFFVQDVPPRGRLNVGQPEIYYGEGPGNWVVVKTNVPEFDYPRGSDNAETTYKGNTGVGIGSFFRRLLFAWQMNDLNLLVTPALRSDSHILFHRNVHARVRKVAPFLLFDADPYLVVDNGKLVWIYDAYTYSPHYPYSQPVSRAFNYLRNSVKVVVDAYDGSMTFYIADREDPLIRAYAGAFPSLFRPIDDMPDGLRSHVRYPGNLFAVQSQMYRLYHMQDPRVFYQREDQLSVPMEVYLGNRRPVQPYYAIMRLPGETREEFVYILPYTPPGKDNMITWLAARSDGANYGKLVAFKYPKETLIFGPMQVEARIDQDPVISAQFTLWNQGGSRVLRGNMLAIPIGGSNLYVEPIYLQAQQSKLPEMKRVIVATGNRVAMGLSVEDALVQLYDGPINFAQAPVAPALSQPAASPPAAAQPAPPATSPAAVPAPPAGTGAPLPADRVALRDAIRSLQQRYQRLQEDHAGVQADLQRLLEALETTP